MLYEVITNTPISKEFSADDTLGIILCAYYLNLDIHSLVDKYHSFGFKNKINTMENKNSVITSYSIHYTKLYDILFVRMRVCHDPGLS